MIRRILPVSIVLVLLCASCGEAVQEEDAAATEPAGSTSVTVSTPSTTVQATAASAGTSKTALAGIEELDVGLFCRDLQPQGYSYAEAVAYWTREGQPDRMDADRNGIPCETVYASAAVLAFWGDPLPTTTTPSPSLESLEARLNLEWPTSIAGSSWGPVSWACGNVVTGPLLTGSVMKCLPVDIPTEGQHPIITVLMVDDVGMFAVAQSGVVNPILDPETIVLTLGSGHLCREITGEGSELAALFPEDETRYFGALLYWFMEGRPSRMDADNNGIPCETVFPKKVVDAVWAGGWFGG